MKLQILSSTFVEVLLPGLANNPWGKWMGLEG